MQVRVVVVRLSCRLLPEVTADGVVRGGTCSSVCELFLRPPSVVRTVACSYDMDSRNAYIIRTGNLLRGGHLKDGGGRIMLMLSEIVRF